MAKLSGFRFLSTASVTLWIEAVDLTNDARGNPVCWSSGYDYSVCCGDQAQAEAKGCWNLFFTYESCCLEPYKPTRKCQHSASAEDQLWHCRMRPHWQTERCFQLDEREASHVRTLYSGNYIRYQKLQREKANRELEMRFISERAAEVVGLYVTRHSGQHEISGICHGAKTGAEVRLIRKALAGHGVLGKFWGTDITPEAAAASDGDVIMLDFHSEVPEWLQSSDFVYSNTLDHSYNPLKALETWRRQLRSLESLLILQHSDLHLSLMAFTLTSDLPMTSQLVLSKQLQLEVNHQPIIKISKNSFSVVFGMKMDEDWGYTVDEVDIFGGSLGDYCGLSVDS